MAYRKRFSAGLLVILLFLVSVSSVSADSMQFIKDLQQAYRDLSEEVLPVVVQVNTVDIVERRSLNPFDFFFRSPNEEDKEPFETQPFRQQGVGSGVIVDHKGNSVYVLTNNHVVEGADEIEITLYDERVFTGKLVGGDQLMDLALLEFKTREDIPVAVLGDSDDVHVGDLVLAIGSPLGFESTVTSGIISAKGRTGAGPKQSFTDYLQTDAAINRGNSGGVLINIDGKVIGINTFIASNSGGSIGLGFAIPINNARRAIEDFITKGSVDYAWLGVNMGDVNDTISEELNLDDESGAFIYNVYGKSPAMKGGIQPGDLLIRLGGKSINSANDLSRTVASLSPDRTVPVTLIREGKRLNINIILDVRTIEKDGLRVNVWPGFSVVPLTSELREQMKLARNAGNVLIGSVVKDSPASALGLRSGDVIRSINGRNVRNFKGFYSLVNSGDRLELKIFRQGHELEFILNNK